MQFVDPRTGRLTEFGIRMLAQWRANELGVSRLIACEAVGTNVITLTPRAPTPVIGGYYDFDGYQFIAAGGSTGAVTAAIQPDPAKSDLLAFLKVYKNAGAAQAGNTDVVAGAFYIAFYVHSLDGGNGGLVLK